MDYIKIRLDSERYTEAAQAISYFNAYNDFDRQTLSTNIILSAKKEKKKIDFGVILSLIDKNHPQIDDIKFINVLILKNQFILILYKAFNSTPLSR